MAAKKKAPTIKAAKKAVPKEIEKVEEQPDESEKKYEEDEPFFEQLPEENIIQDEPSISDILKRNKK